MKSSRKRIALAVVIIFLATFSVRIADSALDDIGRQWKDRAEAASKRLATSELDECDKAVERAFQDVKESVSGAKRIFELKINISDQTMVVYYSFEGQRLGDFVLGTLPPGWVAIQKTDSKTISILVGKSDCAFDLCTSNPFIIGPCTEGPVK